MKTHPVKIDKRWLLGLLLLAASASGYADDCKRLAHEWREQCENQSNVEECQEKVERRYHRCLRRERQEAQPQAYPAQTEPTTIYEPPVYWSTPVR